jgi:hypothetical protein
MSMPYGHPTGRGAGVTECGRPAPGLPAWRRSRAREGRVPPAPCAVLRAPCGAAGRPKQVLYVFWLGGGRHNGFGVSASSPRLRGSWDIGDVVITAAASGQMLRFNGASWVNEDSPYDVNLVDLRIAVRARVALVRAEAVNRPKLDPIGERNQAGGRGCVGQLRTSCKLGGEPGATPVAGVAAGKSQEDCGLQPSPGATVRCEPGATGCDARFAPVAVQKSSNSADFGPSRAALSATAATGRFAPLRCSKLQDFCGFQALGCDGQVRTANPDSRPVASEISPGAPPYQYSQRKDPDELD